MDRIISEEGPTEEQKLYMQLEVTGLSHEEISKILAARSKTNPYIEQLIEAQENGNQKRIEGAQTDLRVLAGLRQAVGIRVQTATSDETVGEKLLGPWYSG